ncbi:MAG: tetratricopeptide repeat protein, partial [Planctomycetota bacterium]|nr:tetratricopeptide repeat protein [Planctomycetota bacterium]
MSRICALWFAFAATICSGMAGTGVVVESVEPAGGAALSGIEEGQWLLGWERRADGVVAARGPLESPFELERVEIEEAPLGPIRLVGDRVAFDVPPEEWLLRTRPVLDENRGNRLDRLLAAIEGGEIVAALDTLSALASGATDDVLSVWFRVRTADALGDTGAWSKSDALYDEATAASGRVDPSLVAAVRRAQGNLAERHGRQKEAIAAYGRALEAVASASPNGLDVADLLWRSANVSYSLGDLDAAETQLERALELAERTAPESYSVAKTVNTLGKVAFRRGELDEADRRWRRALRLNERLAPEGRGVINLVNN